MTPETLIQKLSALKSIKIEETREHPDGTRVFTISATLPEFPFGRGQVRWYPLVVLPGQTEVPQSEIDALLRRFWMFQVDIS